MWKMKHSHGPQGTVIFYPYVGNVNIYEWVNIAARVMNGVVLAFSMVCTICLCCYKLQQARMDKELSSERLKRLTERWLEVLDQPRRLPGLDFAITKPTDASRPLLAGESQSRHQSTSTSKTNSKPEDSSESITPIRPITVDDTSAATKGQGKDKEFGYTMTHESTGPPPYRRPTRTGTGLLKRGFLGWASSNKDIDLSQPPPEYFAYEPTLPDLLLAMQLLKDSTTAPKSKGTIGGFNFFDLWFKVPRWLMQVIILIILQFYHPFRPAVLFAIASHARNLKHGRKLSYPKCLSLALKHPAYRTVRGSEDVVLASRILVTIEPSPKAPKWAYIAAGWMLFAACSVLIIATELTIQWNDISGVQDLTSVGQLIPFCLGVGGLIKVIWSAFMEQDRVDVERWCYYGACTSVHRMAGWKEAGEGFKKCRDAYERSQDLPGTEKEKTAA